MSRVLIAFLLIMTSVSLPAADCVVYVGTHTKLGLSKGIYSFHFSQDGKAKVGLPRLVAASSNPGFLIQHPTLGILYAAGDSPSKDGKLSGTVRAFSIASKDGDLVHLNTLEVGAPGSPCHLAVTADGGTLLSVYYNTGVVSSLSVMPDGHLGSLVDSIQHKGPTGPNAQRQECPHAHSCTISPDGRFAFACDLGMDRIVRYVLDSKNASLTPASPAFVSTTPGVGPRHARFSSDGRFFYVLNELAGSLDVYDYSAPAGSLTHIQNISTLPENFSGENTSAEIQIHRNGRFVYASNRGPDTLAVFSRDPQSGRLTFVQQVSSGGRHPRHFALTPDSAFLFCANRDTNNIAVFRVSEQSGMLEKTSIDIPVPSPTCVLFAR